jgi:microcystin-dependent protein
MTTTNIPKPTYQVRLIDENGRATRDFYNYLDLFNSQLNLILAGADTITPAGLVAMWDDATAPAGWAIANNPILLIADNPVLFAKWGTTYGGDGVTTFGGIDLRGRGFFHANGTTLIAGTTGGVETNTLIQANLPNVSLPVNVTGHSHTFTGTPHTHIADSHDHTITDAGHNHEGASGNSFVMDGAGTEYLNAAGDKGVVAASTTTETTGITIDGEVVVIQDATATGTLSSEVVTVTVGTGGSGTPITNLPPYWCGYYIFKLG